MNRLNGNTGIKSCTENLDLIRDSVSINMGVRRESARYTLDETATLQTGQWIGGPKCSSLIGLIPN